MTADLHMCDYLQISGPHPLHSHRVFLNASFILEDRNGTRKKALLIAGELCGEGKAEPSTKERVCSFAGRSWS